VKSCSNKKIFPKRKMVFHAALAASLALPIAFGISTNASAQSEFKIGLLAPYSGPAGFYGPIYEKAGKIAVAKINAEGGILGKQVKLIIEDTKFSPPGAVEATQKLTRRDRVHALIGTVNGTATSAVIPVAERAKTPFITTVEGIVAKMGCFRHVYGVGPTPEQKLSAWAPWFIKKTGAKTFYFAGNDYFYPRALAGVIKKAVAASGGKVVGEEYSPIGTTAWSTMLTKAEAAKPDMFFNVAVGGSSITMTKQAQQFGLTKKTNWQVSPGNSSSYLPAINKFSQGAQGTEAYSEAIDNAANRKFIKLYRVKYKSPFPITEVGAAVDSAFHIIKAAAEKAKSFDGGKIADAIGGLSLDLPQGKVTMDAGSHQAILDMYLVEIKGTGLKIVKNFGQARASKQSCG
jgi:urea transport system substrate-binding protein